MPFHSFQRLNVFRIFPASQTPETMKVETSETSEPCAAPLSTIYMVYRHNAYIWWEPLRGAAPHLLDPGRYFSYVRPFPLVIATLTRCTGWCVNQALLNMCSSFARLAFVMRS